MIPLEQLPKRAKEEYKKHKKLLESTKPKTFQKLLYKVHSEVFEEIDCLDCANCCKTISPRFKTPEIKKIAKFLRIKESALIDAYLKVDEEGDFVVKSSPCPFLGADNLCSIYEHRPSDCRRYPYTDEDVFYKKPKTTLNNAGHCPAVFQALERMEKLINNS